MEWNHIKYFLKMAETGSLLSAAKELQVSQPTLSRHLTALEDDLGTAVFTRKTKGLELTAAGEQLREYAEQMSESAMAIERIAMGADLTLAGPVTITVVDSIGTEWLTENLFAFHEKFPDIELTLRIEDSSADLMRKEADIAIRMYRPEQPDLIGKKVGVMTYGLYSSEKYLSTAGEPKKLRDIQDHRMVLATGTILKFVKPLLKEMNIKLGKVAFSANSAIALAKATRMGYGIGIHSSFSALRYPELKPVLNGHQKYSEIWLVTHEDIHRSARIRAVFDYLSELFAGYMKQLRAKEDLSAL
ncbi:LysR family transcriptional regulator [Temperatibacter marinus]|uniref:LysR family transcriptional regulator n=1 Tax=Temperatibacter marinus TaxID=1456591 RepID=A0AA52EEX6_9PROT|nr:LysR family transcriptional regulator [Temperatibacter marinus]WND01833.1 LysR family transcriptional regulator [Temperatibacter marinus]